VSVAALRVISARQLGNLDIEAAFEKETATVAGSP
jgi:hypothetical protein